MQINWTASKVGLLIKPYAIAQAALRHWPQCAAPPGSLAMLLAILRASSRMSKCPHGH
jgi:hypothetical protein